MLPAKSINWLEYIALEQYCKTGTVFDKVLISQLWNACCTVVLRFLIYDTSLGDD